MTFEAMAFKFCPLHIKLSTSNFKLKKGLSSCDKPFLRRFFVVWNKKGLTHRFQRFDGVEIACGSGFLIPRFGLGRIGSYTQAFGVHIA